MIGVGDPFYQKFWIKLTTSSEIADFRSIFARNDSAVKPSKKVQLTLIGIVRCPQAPPPQKGGGSKTQSVKNLNNKLAAITPKRYEIGCHLLLITNRKSHTGF